jgi:hypothetical protein
MHTVQPKDRKGFVQQGCGALRVETLAVAQSVHVACLKCSGQVVEPCPWVVRPVGGAGEVLRTLSSLVAVLHLSIGPNTSDYWLTITAHVAV